MRKISAITLFVLLILSGCSGEQVNGGNASGNSASRKFGIEEAKTAFAETYSTALTKSADGGNRRNKLSPGEFTPLWDKATYSENSQAGSYDVSLIPGRRICALIAEFCNGKSFAEKVCVSQRLVAVKHEHDSRVHCYILSLIPGCGCDGGERMAEQFRSSACKGNFSGLAVYSSLGTDAILRIDRYRDGKKTEGVYIPGGNGTQESRLEKAASMLRGISLINKRAAVTKSFGEDIWDDDDWSSDDNGWDYGSPDDYADLGDGYFEDADGNLYYDTDGDGMPDTMVVEGGGIDGNDDGDGEDDSWWLWEPDSDEDGDGNPEEDPYYNTNDDFDGHTGEDGGNDVEVNKDYKRGKEGLKKIQEDLEKGNVKMLEAVNGMLTGFSIGVNANGILISAATCIETLANTKVIQDFGKNLGGAGFGISAAQTAIVLFNDGELSTGDVLSLVSAGLQASAMVAAKIPIPHAYIVSGALGITSAVVGLVSIFISEGMYIMEAPNGELIYIYISSNTINFA